MEHFDPGLSQAEIAYLRLEEMLVTLELAPGSVQTEGALIGRLAMGRTPVREAIQRLAWEGFLQIRPRAGLAVAPLEPGDWLKVIEARRGVEAVLARAAARNLTPGAALGFRDAALAMEAAVTRRDIRAFLLADKDFDQALAAAADNVYAARLAGPLQTHSRRFWFARARADDLAEAAEHHVALITAIVSRDEDLAGEEALRLMALLAEMAEAST
ncbi:MAG: GntR family transcriptional regulator [Notoacmeibacter sp.]|nr:GntR family transcriptional regulator [Notoacmeibacter sp.]